MQILHSDYRDAPGADYDAVSSIGLMEHVGVGNYPAYFAFVKAKLRDGGRLLNHCITRPDNRQSPLPGQFIDRYVFPDGELTGSGRIITEAQDAGLEVRHEENLREHYALTLTKPGARTWSATGIGAWPTSARPPPGSGACTWPVRDWASRPTVFSCTRCWRSSSTRAGRARLPAAPELGLIARRTRADRRHGADRRDAALTSDAR